MDEFVTEIQAIYYSRITSITVNGKAAYELKGRFLYDLRENTFNGTNREGVVEHIEYFLKIVDPIDLPNVDNKEGVTNEGLSDLEEANNEDEHKITEIFRIEINLFDYETPFLKDESLKQKAIYEKSWGNATQSVVNFYPWLKRSFGNFHEIDYELLVKLKECWWKINDHECSLFTNWRDHIRGPYANVNTTYHHYLDSRNGRAGNDSNVQEEEEQHNKGQCDLFDNLAQESPVCKVRRFDMFKYSFGQEEEYVAAKEYEYDDLTRTNKDTCHAYQEIFYNMDEGWLVTRAE
ncbi:hypothetical protein Tco_0654656 [Tanacetum coccineum]|uniref:Uncharacterized protein n=1 Tax=Tanacetum coccineum TaxID=301880 RepID=A0ABQ4X438_9ASTR